jgi:hypothetical protein
MANRNSPFHKLETKLAREPGISNPAALAASIGRKKYGTKAYNAKIAKGKLGGK